MSTAYSLPDGLPRAESNALAALVAEISGRELIVRPPLTAPLLLLSNPVVQAALPLPEVSADQILVHDYQSIALEADLPLDTPLSAELLRRDKHLSVEFDIQVDEGIALRSALRIVTRHELAQAAPLQQGPGITTSVEPFRISAAQVLAYVDLAGDPNPIHRDATAARALGFGAPVVPGALLMALAQPALEAESQVPKITNARARFIAPVLVDQPISASVQQRGPGKARVSICSDRGMHAVADLAYA